MGSIRLTFRLPAARQDELVAELWALGTAGVHFRQAVGESERLAGELLDAYFEKKTQVRKEDLSTVAERCDADLIEVAEVEPRDWLAAYRENAEPMTIGAFLVDPREPELGGPSRAVGAADDTVHELHIPARNAFGTGSHESTRLLLEEIGRLDLGGRTVLDVGTGSGILSFAALRRGARAVVAFDPDTASVVTARDNSGLNDLAPRLFAGRVGAVAGRFDVVLVNILPDRWLAEAENIVERLRSAGELLVSGLLTTGRDQVLAVPALASLDLLSERALGEWASLRFRRSADG